MDLTVLIATYRRPQLLRRTLEAYALLESQEISWKLVLVDNADDAETQALAREFEEVLPLELVVERRRGKNPALNTGLRYAEGGLYVFSDDDAMPAKDWLGEIWSGSCRWPAATMFTGRIVPSWPAGHRTVELRTDLLRSAYMVTDWGDEEGDISPDRLWGPNLAIRSGPFLEGFRFNPSIGPSAGRYAMGSELELTLRLAREGHRAVYLPKAVVKHQIRTEQMEESWLAGRAYRSGRGVARLQGAPPAPRLFGVPRFVFREVASHGLAWATGWLARHDHKRLDGKLGFYHWQGKLQEYWNARGVESGDRAR